MKIEKKEIEGQDDSKTLSDVVKDIKMTKNSYSVALQSYTSSYEKTALTTTAKPTLEPYKTARDGEEKGKTLTVNEKTLLSKELFEFLKKEAFTTSLAVLLVGKMGGSDKALKDRLKAARSIVKAQLAKGVVFKSKFKYGETGTPGIKVLLKRFPLTMMALAKHVQGLLNYTPMLGDIAIEGYYNGLERSLSPFEIGQCFKHKNVALLIYCAGRLGNSLRSLKGYATLSEERKRNIRQVVGRLLSYPRELRKVIISEELEKAMMEKSVEFSGGMKLLKILIT
jgi:hypothetical protein